jgi:tRNA uridine 5-carboxymethylaminomethyl modification enzyme
MRVQGEGRGLTALPVPEELEREPIEVLNEVLYRISYAGYLQRESKQIEKLSDMDSVRIPADMDFKSIRGLCIECAEKLAAFKPFSLGQASRISGVSPSDISVLLVVLNSRSPRERVARPVTS